MLIMELDTLFCMMKSEKREKIREHKLLEAFKKMDEILEDALCQTK